MVGRGPRGSRRGELMMSMINLIVYIYEIIKNIKDAMF